MGDVELDLAALRLAKIRAAGALTTFQGAERVGGDLADLTGDPRLSGKVRDFAGNWDDNRGKLEQQLTAVHDLIDAIVDTMSELDQSMADASDTSGAGR